MKTRLCLIVLCLLLVGAMLANLFVGSMPIPAGQVWRLLTGEPGVDAGVRFIVMESRLPQMLTAACAGAALAMAGLMLQTFFGNALADPSILGVHSGASLGVAVVMLWMGGGVVLTSGLALTGMLVVMLAAFVGAVAALVVLLLCSVWLHNRLLLLIVGIMMGYAASSVVTLLNFSASAQNIHTYVLWGMGDFSSVTLNRLPLLLVPVVLCLAGLLLAKPLNALLLGERYAANAGLNMKVFKWQVLLLTGALSAVVTALCGPIAFVGLVVPHLARWIFKTSDHRLLLPVCLLGGAFVLTLAYGVCRLFPETLPINSVMPIVGIPVVAWVVFRRRLS